MEIDLYRIAHGHEATIGSLHINGGFQCFTCEDQWQLNKVDGETRIPAGRYQIILRNEGGMTKRYKRKFPVSHKGMLWLQDVPGFKYIYIHIGNTDDDTFGCILVGNVAYGDEMLIRESKNSYLKVYKKISMAIINNEDVHVTVHDRLIRY